MEPNPIRAVTFDAGGTLIEPWPSVGHIYAEVAARHGCGKPSPAKLSEQFAAAWHARRDFDYSRLAWFELVRQTFAGLIDSPPNEDFFAALYERFTEPSAWRVFDDVLPALFELQARGFQLALISNWDERLRPLLERLALARLFDATVISLEAGHAKPSPEIFRRAAAQLGLPAEALLHVGDSVREDFDGARKAGLHGVLLDRGATQPGRLAINSLGALPELLEGMGSKGCAD